MFKEGGFKLDLSTLNDSKLGSFNNTTNHNLTINESVLNKSKNHDNKNSKYYNDNDDKANLILSNNFKTHFIDEFIKVYDTIKSRKLTIEESNIISNYAVKLLNHLEVPIRDPSLVTHKYNNLKQEFLNLREKYESSKSRLRIYEKNIMNLNRDVKKYESKWMNIVRNSTYQEQNIEYMNQTILNLESKLDEVTKQC